MFLALDESLDGVTKVIGCVCFPMNNLGGLEKEVAEFRATQRMWSEFKWNKINERYAQQYISFVNIFAANSSVTFHTWAYKELPIMDRIRVYRTSSKTDVFYKNTYSLIRSVIRKSMREGVTRFYVLADETGPLGKENFKKYNEMLSKDRMVSGAQILHCATAKSHISSPLQMADLVTGTIAKGCYGSIKESGKQKLYDYFLSINDLIDLDITTKHLPGLYDMKVHHCNIDRFYTES